MAIKTTTFQTLSHKKTLAIKDEAHNTHNTQIFYQYYLKN